MSLIWVILGSISQLCLSVFVFMLTAFMGGGIANGRDLSSLQSKIIDLSLFVLPCLCLISAGIVIYQYSNSGTSSAYWWYSMPIIATIAYVIYASRF
jgi:hypothetical protein